MPTSHREFFYLPELCFRRVHLSLERKSRGWGFRGLLVPQRVLSEGCEEPPRAGLGAFACSSIWFGPDLRLLSWLDSWWQVSRKKSVPRNIF